MKVMDDQSLRRLKKQLALCATPREEGWLIRTLPISVQESYARGTLFNH